MRKIYSFRTALLMAVLSFVSVSAFAQPTVLGTQAVSGAYVTYNLSTVGGFKQVRLLATSSASSGARNWEFAQGTAGGGEDYSTNWRPYTAGNTLSGYNAFIDPATALASARYNTGFGGQSGLMPAVTSGNYYTFNVSNNSVANNNMAVLETSFNPVTIPTVTDAVGTYGSRLVSITTSGTPSSGENIFVRYSTNSYVSSTIVQATGSGSAWSATIPWQSAAVSYYVYTSNRTLAGINTDVTSFGQGAHDMATLNVNNNGGSNYSWTPTTGDIIVSSAGGTFATPIGYTSLTNAAGAFAAINGSGASTGAITVLITANVTTEAGTNALNAAASNWTTIGIQPNGARTISGNVATPLINLNGAGNVTIDGLNSGGNSLIIDNASITTTASTIQFIADASSNTIQNCTIKGSGTGTAVGTIQFSTGTATGNDNNIITANTITTSVATLPLNAVYSFGTSTAIDNSGISITNNNIQDYFGPGANSNGVFVAANSSAWTITGNKFFQSGTRTPTAANQTRAINIVTASGVGYTVSNNIIGYATSGSTGTTTYAGGFANRFFGIDLTVGTASASNVQGNTITAISFTTTSGAPTVGAGIFQGISVLAGTVNVGTTTANIIGATSGTGSISITSTTSTGYIAGIYSASTGTLNIQGNTIGSISTGGAAAIGYTIHGISVAGTVTGGCTVSNNTVGNSTTSNITSGVLGTTTAASTIIGIFSSATGAVTIGSSGNPNTIQNIRLNAVATNACQGITNSGAATTLNINFNVVKGVLFAAASSTASAFNGIVQGGAVTTTVNVTNNEIGTAATGAVTFSAATTGQTNTIINTAGAAAATINLNNNTIVGLSYVTSGQISAVANTAASPLAINIKDNFVGTAATNWVTFSGAQSSALLATINQAGPAAGLLTITGNEIRGISQPTLGSNSQTYISNTIYTGSTNISSNKFINITSNSTGGVTFISNSVSHAASTTHNVNSNQVVTQYTKTGTGGTILFYNAFGSSASSVTEINNLNDFSNLTFTGATIIGWRSADGTTPGSRKTITNNTFNNITNNTSGDISSILYVGFSDNTFASNNVSGNTISNITGNGALVTGIFSDGQNQNFFSNSVFTLSSTAAAAVVSGISITGATTQNVYKNKIYDLSASNATGTVNGIVATSTGGTHNIYNNLIGDLRTPAGTGLNAVNGINANGASTFNVYFNTIYLNATSSGATFGSSCITFLSTATSLNLRNNNLLNLSTPGTVGANLASNGISAVLRRGTGTAATVPANYATTSNKNNFWVNPVAGTNNHCTYVEGTATITNSMNTYAQMKTFMVTRDQNSYADQLGTTATNVSSLVSTAGSNANFLNIVAATTTQLESGADPIAGITDDYSGAAGNRTTTPDVGAWEFAGTLLDLAGPVITYTTLSNAGAGPTSRTTASFATITDVSGVNGTAGTRPRIYYKKTSDANNTFNDNTSATVGWKYAEATGSTSVFDFVIDYTLLNNGPVVVGDVIQYFVVAQDNAGTPNVGINSGTFNAIPASVALTATAFPIGGTINSYTILASISGTITVPGTYASLTLAGGAFAAINAAVVNGDITILITADLAGETGANLLEEFASPYTITIKPTGAPRIITGSSADGLIKLNGADRVTIDGSLGSTVNTVCPLSAASRDLTIVNSSAAILSVVIWLKTNTGGVPNGATNNTIKNCNIDGSGNTQTLVGIFSGSSTIGLTSLGTGNNNNSIINNSIRKTQYGIYSQGASAASKNTGNTINQNLMNIASPNNIGIGGILVGFEDGITISGNSISGMAQTGTNSVFGMSVGYAPASILFTATTGNEVTNATISKNVINGLTNTSTTGYSAVGIAIASAATGTTTISNNMISNVTSYATPDDVCAGILVGGGAATTRIYFNTVNLTGARSSGASGGTSPSYALGINGSTPNIDIKNNILMNSTTSGNASPGKSYAIGLGYTSTLGNYTNLLSDNNDLFVSGAQGVFGKVGSLTQGSGTEMASLAAWTTETGRDGASKNVGITFLSSTNLHIDNTVAANITNLNNTGATGTGITDDIDCQTRGSLPDIGADEFSTPYTWTGGTSTVWSLAANWSPAFVPNAIDNAIIPNVANKPTLTGAATIKDIDMAASAYTDINGQTFTINGAVTGSGTLSGSATSNLTIGGTAGTLNFTTGSRTLKDLTLSASATATLGTPLDITAGASPATNGTVVVNSAATLTTGGNLTIKSDANGTARIGTSAGTITGNVTVERYIKLRLGGTGRAYRLLAPTVNTSGSIQDNWMETGMNTAIGTNIDPFPTYGTQITGAGGNTNGFDKTASNSPSLYNTTNAVTPTYSAIGSTGGTLNALTGYFMYVRGDRSMDMTLPLAAAMPTSSTTLRTTGTILQGTKTSFTNAFIGGTGTMNLVTNPYPSAIDWSLVYAASGNVTTSYTFWDPNFGTRGGFVTVNTAGTASSGLGTQYIQSGQAFFVEASGASAPTVSIQEAHKVANNNNDVFGPTPAPPESFRTELYFTEPNGFRRIADGVTAVYDNNYSAGLDGNDANEINNWDENIAIARAGKHLAIESRPVIMIKDTLPLFMNNMRQMAYEFQFTPESFTNPLLKAELIDNFLGTRTLLSVTAPTVVSFTVTSNPASSATDRFKVVFGGFGGPLAIDLLTIKAAKKNTGVQVDWVSKSENDMDRYEVERSVNGSNFSKVNTTTAIGNSSSPVNYSWFDAAPVMGNNFYRIKAMDKGGNIRYSSIVKVFFGTDIPGIVVYPNPVSGNTLNVDMNNMAKGIYQLSLVNNIGQTVFTTQVQHNGGSATKTIELNRNIVSGTYRLVLTGTENVKLSSLIIKN